jgi:ADP-ribose pyrophosphatase YjhB (NUDIX family)
MAETPRSVVVPVLIHKGKILLTKRRRSPYASYWALPGGRVEKHEHVSTAAIRGILKETGITTQFKDYRGFVSKHLLEQGRVAHHFLLHVFMMEPMTTTVAKEKEKSAKWFDLKYISQMKNVIIPSDFMIITKMLHDKGKNYYDCVLEKDGKKRIMRSFE